MPKKPTDNLPGKFEERVFIGGNYDQIADLRNIASFVKESGFTPILPYDDFILPEDQIHDWDLRLLHCCNYAIFDVTQPGGELMEIERTRDYGVKTLLVHQIREKKNLKTDLPSKVKTMLLQSGSHETRGYTDFPALEAIIEEFLLQKNPSLFKLSVNTFGYKFSTISVFHSLHKDHTAKHRWQYDGLVVPSNINLTEITHEFDITYGKPVTLKFTSSRDGIEWIEDPKRCTSLLIAGVVRLDPPLKTEDKPLNYAFELETKGAFALDKGALDHLAATSDVSNEPLIQAGYEFVGQSIVYPCEKAILSVQFFNGYDVTPEATAFHGTEKHPDAIRPPDKLVFENNKAELDIRTPTIFYRYIIYWEVPKAIL